MGGQVAMERGSEVLGVSASREVSGAARGGSVSGNSENCGRTGIRNGVG